jgi:hypothetical protein
VIYTNRYARTENGPGLLLQVAEIARALRWSTAICAMNIANRHPLNHSQRGEAALQQADVILALEPIYLWGLNNYVPDLVTRPNDPRRRNPNLKLIHIGTESMMAKSNYQDFQRFVPADLHIAGDAEATVPVADRRS